MHDTHLFLSGKTYHFRKTFKPFNEPMCTKPNLISVQLTNDNNRQQEQRQPNKNPTAF